MSEQKYIEDEVARRLSLIMRGHDEDMADLRAKLQNAKFDAAVAQWAVAGAMNANVRFCVSPAELETVKVHELARHFAAQAVGMMLEKADLAFRQHSELWRLKASAYQPVEYRDPMPSVPPPEESWPKPFKGWKP